MKKNNRGFTLIEILSVMFVIGLIMTIAVPSILNLSKRFKGEGIEAKLELIEKAAVDYVQSNSNKIKEECLNGNIHCDEVIINQGQEYQYIVYKFNMTIEELVKKGGYDAEQYEDDIDDTHCNVPYDGNKNYCLDKLPITVNLHKENKTATAEISNNELTEDNLNKK